MNKAVAAVATILAMLIGFEIGWHLAVIEMGLRAQQPASQQDDGDEEESAVPISTVWRLK
jgi:hypothetical protein